jgi:hypothetical protein
MDSELQETKRLNGVLEFSVAVVVAVKRSSRRKALFA